MKRINLRMRVLLAALLAVGTIALTSPANAATLSSISLRLEDSRPGDLFNDYTFTQSNVTLAPIKCIRVEFDSAADGSGGKPALMSIGGAGLWNGGTNYVPTPGSWSVSNNDGTGVWTITNAAGETPASASARTFVITNINNHTVAGTYYALVSTFNNTDCSTSPVDSGVVAFALTSGTTVSTVVDPSLTFTVFDNATDCNGVNPTAGTSGSGSAINLGRVNTGNLPFRSQYFVTSTNASNGFTIYTRYAGPMNDGAGHNIANWTGTNAAPTPSWSANTEAFGYTADDSTLGTGTPDRFTNGGPKFAAFTTTDAEVKHVGAPVSNAYGCVGYQMGVAGTTRAGAYSTTVIYTVVPGF